MQKKPFFKFIKAILISALLSTNLALTCVSYAESPQTKNKDAIRIENYQKVINGYINELLALCDTDMIGKEYIALNVYHIGTIPPPYGLETAFEEFRDAASEPGNNLYGGLPAGHSELGQIAYEPISKVFALQLSAASEYPRTKDPLSGRYTAHSNAPDLQNLNELTALIDKKVSGLKVYLTRIKRHYQKALIISPNQKDLKNLFDCAKNGAGYAWKISRIMPKFKLDAYKKKYLLDKALYPAYKKYYDDLYDAHVTSYSETRYSPFKAIDRTNNTPTIFTPASEITWELSQSGWGIRRKNIIARIDLSKYAYKEIATGTMPNQECSQPPSTFNTGEEKIARTYFGGIPLKTYFNIAALGAKFDDWVSVPPCYKTDALSYLTAEYTAYNNWITKQNTALTNFANGLNAALKPFPHYLPYALTNCAPGNCLTLGENLNQRPKVTQEPPEETLRYDSQGRAILNFGEIKITGSSGNITLDASKKITDPDKDRLQYRWVIIEIPETQEAKSESYALYQVLSNEEKCNFKPDLDGEWKLAIEANDGEYSLELRQYFGEDTGSSALEAGGAVAVIKATRHILWIQHNDKDTTLELYAGFDKPLPVVTLPQVPNGLFHTGSYFLEAARDQVGMFRNYNDAGKPVDIDSGYAPKTDYIYKVYRGYIGAYPKGAYDGRYGSTDMVHEQGGKNPNIFRQDLSSLELKSASDKSGSVSLYVEVADPQICELVLSNKNSPYGLKFKRTGGYYIQQWVDNASWVNDHGSGPEGSGQEGFRQLPRPNGVPDWLERFAGECVLNEFTGYLPDVEKILVYKGGKKGQYRNGERVIYINPDYSDIRYNSHSISRYGFLVTHGLQGITLFLADKSHYYWSVLSPLAKKIPDNDRDLLPMGNGGAIVEIAPARDLLGRIGSKFEALAASILFELSGASINFFSYLADLDSNQYGPQVQANLTYRGDNELDNEHGQEKLLQVKYNFQTRKIEDNNAFLTQDGLSCILPFNLPIDSVPKVDIFINCQRQKGKPAGPVKIHFLQGKHYTYGLRYLFTLQAKVLGINIGALAGLNTFPVLDITFKKPMISFADELARSGYVMTDPWLNIIYTVHIPFAIADLNAASKTGIYTGQFNRFFTDDY